MYDTVKTAKIDQYMKDIEEYHLISHERERELFNIMQTGSPYEKEAAREELICSSLRLVVKIAHDYKAHNLPFDDLIQEGNIGLVIAADKFDPDKCPKFGVFASWWIKQRMRRAVVEKTGTIRIPNGAAQLAAKKAKLRNSYMAEFNREPTVDELSELMGISKQRVEAIDNAEFSTVSINSKVNEDDETTFEDMLLETVDTQAVEEENLDVRVVAMRKALEHCTDRDKFILQRLYGISCKPVSMDIIAQETGWNVSRIKGRIGNLMPKLKEKITLTA